MLWCVGKTFSDLRGYLQDHHIPVGIFVDIGVPNKLPPDIPTIAIDFSSPARITASLSGHNPDITAVVSIYENYVVPTAIIAKHYGVPGLSLEAAKNCTDKVRMRQCFMDHNPAITPAFAAVQEWDDARVFANEHAFPLVLKPAGLAKSLLVTISHSLEELKQNYNHSVSELARTSEQYHFDANPLFIIEEYLEGSMHTVAAFADSEGAVYFAPQIADCLTGSDIGVQDNFIFSRTLPSSLTLATQQELYRVAEEGVRALKLRNTAAHVELMLTDQGPKIIEIGARVGGYRSRLYRLAVGIDLNRAMIDVASGKQPDLTGTRTESCAAIELFPREIGEFKDIDKLADVHQLKSFEYVHVKAQAHDTVGPAQDGYKACATIILHAADPAQVKHDLAFIRDNVRVQVAATA